MKRVRGGKHRTASRIKCHCAQAFSLTLVNTKSEVEPMYGGSGIDFSLSNLAGVMDISYARHPDLHGYQIRHGMGKVIPCIQLPSGCGSPFFEVIDDFRGRVKAASFWCAESLRPPLQQTVYGAFLVRNLIRKLCDIPYLCCYHSLYEIGRSS